MSEFRAPDPPVSISSTTSLGESSASKNRMFHNGAGGGPGGAGGHGQGPQDQRVGSTTSQGQAKDVPFLGT